MDLRGAISKAILPTNVRLLLSSLSGEKSPITNADFTDDELNTLKGVYASRKGINDRRMTPTLSPPEVYNQNPYQKDIFDPKSGKMSYDEYVQSEYDRTKSYKKNPNKTSIGYNDYAEGLGGDSATGGNVFNLLRKLYNPSYNLATTIGAANVYDMGDRAQLRDVYDFDTSSAQYKNRPFQLSDLWNNPLEVVDRYASQQGISRPVQIDWQK